MATSSNILFPSNITLILNKDFNLRTFQNPLDVNKLQVLDIDDFWTISNDIEETILYKTTPLLTRGKFISSPSYVRLINDYPNDPITLRSNKTYNVPKITTDIKTAQIPESAEDLITLYNELVVIPRNIIINNDASDIAIWLCLFCYYDKSFCSFYDDYLFNIDEGISVITDIREYLTDTVKLDTRDYLTTSFDIRASCHTILISMNKNFTQSGPDRDRQLKNYIQKRKSAVYASMGSILGELIYKDQLLLNISDTFRITPKLRKMLFTFMYTRRDLPEMATASVLLLHSSMTTIRSIFDFINLEEKTMAHSEPIILEEIHRFINMINRKKDLDGAMWPYHRILHPDDGELNSANFPNLAVSAIEYFREYGAPSFKQMAKLSLPISPGLLKKCTIKDTRGLYKEIKSDIYSDEAKLGAKILGLDIAKLSGSPSLQNSAGVTAEKEDQFRLLMSQMSQFFKS